MVGPEVPTGRRRRRLTMPRVVALAGGTTVILAGLTYAVVAAGRPAAGPRFATAPVRRGTVSLVYQATGELAPAESYTGTLPSGASIASLPVSPGQSVSSGQVLAVFSDPGLALQLANAQAALLKAQSALAALQSPTAGASTVAAAQAALAQASAGVAADQAAVGNLTVASTASGAVTILVAPGQAVAANQVVATEGAVNYAAPDAGTVAAVHVANGAHVAPGQALVTLNDPALTAKLAADQAAVAQDRAALASAEAAGSAASQAAAVAAGQAAVSADQNTAAALSQAVAGLKVTAPFAGQVVYASSSGAGSKVVVLDSTSRIVNVPVPETELQYLRTGQAVGVSLPAYPTGKFSGAVSAIPPVGLYANGVSSFTVQIALAGMSGVRYYDLSANVAIQLKSVRGALVVPLAALGRAHGHPAVRVLAASGQVHVVPVQVLLTSTASAAVSASQLAVGDRVIIAQPAAAGAQKKLRTKGRAVRGGAHRGRAPRGGGKP